MRLSGRGVTCVRGGRVVFAGLDFEAAAGEVLAVTGANGSGKTSLLRLIAGLLIPAEGSVALESGEAGAKRHGKPCILAGFSRRRAP